MLAGLLKSLRPHQWVKNVLLFGALFFSGNLFVPEAVLRALAGFVIFCGLSSSVYLVNDILDRERDRLHPVKRHRPIAAGRVPVMLGWATAAALLAGGLVAGWLLGYLFFLTAVTYAAVSFLYSFLFKRWVIIDVMVLAFGYTLRAIAGAEAIPVGFSGWLLLCTSLLALFLGFCKRRQELTSLGEEAASHRSVLANYTEPFLDQMIAVVTGSTVISYMLYAFSPDVADKLGTEYLGATVPFVLYGIFRYFYLVHVRGEGGHPTRELLGDAPLVLNVCLYAISVVIVLYLA
jgi:4-hydroxybenzoate polyprenyltransferase